MYFTLNTFHLCVFQIIISSIIYHVVVAPLSVANAMLDMPAMVLTVESTLTLMDSLTLPLPHAVLAAHNVCKMLVLCFHPFTPPTRPGF
jgi:hypothetical protein